MPQRYKVKFEGRDKCIDTPEYLRKHPECGVIFYDRLPFNPSNKPEGVIRTFPIYKYQSVGLRPSTNPPFMPPYETEKANAIGDSIYSTPVLPQDRVNDVQPIVRNRALTEDGYARIPTTNQEFNLYEDPNLYDIEASRPRAPPPNARPEEIFENYPTTGIEMENLSASPRANDWADEVRGLELQTERQLERAQEVIGGATDMTEEELIDQQMRDTGAGVGFDLSPEPSVQPQAVERAMNVVDLPDEILDRILQIIVDDVAENFNDPDEYILDRPEPIEKMINTLKMSIDSFDAGETRIFVEGEDISLEDGDARDEAVKAVELLEEHLRSIKGMEMLGARRIAPEGEELSFAGRRIQPPEGEPPPDAPPAPPGDEPRVRSGIGNAMKSLIKIFSRKQVEPVETAPVIDPRERLNLADLPVDIQTQIGINVYPEELSGQRDYLRGTLEVERDLFLDEIEQYREQIRLLNRTIEIENIRASIESRRPNRLLKMGALQDIRRLRKHVNDVLTPALEDREIAIQEETEKINRTEFLVEKLRKGKQPIFQRDFTPEGEPPPDAPPGPPGDEPPDRPLNLTDLDDDVKEKIMEQIGLTREETRLTAVRDTLQRQIDQLNKKTPSLSRNVAIKSKEQLIRKINEQLKVKSYSVYNRLIHGESSRGPQPPEGEPPPDAPPGPPGDEPSDEPRRRTGLRNRFRDVAERFMGQTTREQPFVELPQFDIEEGTVRRPPRPQREASPLIALTEDEELEVVINEAQKFIKRPGGRLTPKQVDKIVRKLLGKGMTKASVLQHLADSGYIVSVEHYENTRSLSTADRNIADSLQRVNEEIEMRNLRTDAQDVAVRPEFLEIDEETGLMTRFTDEPKTRQEKTLIRRMKRLQAGTGETLSEMAQRTKTGIKSIQESIGEMMTTRPEYKPIVEELDFSPFDEAIPSSAEKPRLSFNERLAVGRRNILSTETATGVAGGVAGFGVGMGVGILLGKAGADQYTTAGVAGASGNLTALGATHMANSVATFSRAEGESLGMALTRSAGEGLMASASRAGLMAIGRSALEGGVIGIATIPVDMFLNQQFKNAGMNNTASHMTTTGVIMGGITAASIAAAPESFGTSLIVGSIIGAGVETMSFFMGQDEDKREREQKEINERNDRNYTFNLNRSAFMRELENNNYDLAKTQSKFKQPLGEEYDDSGYTDWWSNITQTFAERPDNKYKPPTPADPKKQLSGDEKRINDLYTQYITHSMILTICGERDCGELKSQDPGAISQDDMKFLNDKTDNMWIPSANLAIDQSMATLRYNTQRTANAQTEIMKAWMKDQTVANQLDPYILETANLDPTFQTNLNRFYQDSAQQMVYDAYYKDQTKIDQLPKNVRDMANLDPNFNETIHDVYHAQESIAGQLNISVPQLQYLQQFTGEKQVREYQSIQFNITKQNEQSVKQAQQIAEAEDTVREAGFYDIDQALLDSDPHAIETWYPTDSQILQAHSAGMSLQQYVDYMHELSKGEAGDYKKTPMYSVDIIRKQGAIDFKHFEEELTVAGYDPTMWSYNEDNLEIRYVGNDMPTPYIHQTHIDRYMPGRMLKERQEVVDGIIGLNKENQAQVDNYNNQLQKQISEYGKNYEQIVAQYNDELLYQGRNDLLNFHGNELYQQNMLVYTPAPERFSDYGVAGSVDTYAHLEMTHRKQLLEEEKAEQLGLKNPTQLHEVKNALQDKGIKSPSVEQVTQVAKNITETSETEQV